MTIAKRRLLKAAQTALDMHQEDYVALLMRITGKNSSTKLNLKEINAVLNEFKRLGYKPSNHKERAIKYISYLWMLLGEHKKLRDPSRAAMIVFCNRITKAGLYKADKAQLSSVIEALKAWCKRENIEFKGL